MSTSIRVGKLSELTPDPKNSNAGTERGLGLLETSLRQLGAGRSILADKHGNILAGNKTALRCADLGMDDVIIVPTDGTRLVVVQRTDLDLDTDPRARQLAVADNRVGVVDYAEDANVLADIVADGVDLGDYYTDLEMDAILRSAERESPEDPEPLKDLARYPLAIVLSHADWKRWQAHKDAVGIRDDTQALLALME